MESDTISARIELNSYANKVLAVLKAKYGLKDKSEAINKFAELYGNEFVEKEANEEYIKKMIEGVNEHLKKYKNRRMTSEELDALFEVNV
ncbi:MAG: DUF2683 family protein [archaeon]|nr:DUF2683 family protein [archaeon]